jgi:hypothetical protein
VIHNWKQGKATLLKCICFSVQYHSDAALSYSFLPGPRWGSLVCRCRTVPGVFLAVPFDRGLCKKHKSCCMLVYLLGKKVEIVGNQCWIQIETRKSLKAFECSKFQNQLIKNILQLVESILVELLFLWGYDNLIYKI